MPACLPFPDSSVSGAVSAALRSVGCRRGTTATRSICRILGDRGRGYTLAGSHGVLHPCDFCQREGRAAPADSYGADHSRSYDVVRHVLTK